MENLALETSLGYITPNVGDPSKFVFFQGHHYASLGATEREVIGLNTPRAFQETLRNLKHLFERPRALCSSASIRDCLSTFLGIWSDKVD